MKKTFDENEEHCGCLCVPVSCLFDPYSDNFAPGSSAESCPELCSAEVLAEVQPAPGLLHFPQVLGPGGRRREGVWVHITAQSTHATINRNLP